MLASTPPYYDYNWTVRGNVDEVYGKGFTEKIKAALLKLNPQDNADILELFSTQKFVATQNSNYDAIEQVGRGLGMIQ